jgi:hypothetical protein
MELFCVIPFLEREPLAQVKGFPVFVCLLVRARYHRLAKELLIALHQDLVVILQSGP